MILITMGSVRDFFKPSDGNTICDMLTYYNRHMWSPDAQTWEVPDYYPEVIHLGGTVAGWPANNEKHPTDQRKHLSFWGKQEASKGGCCQGDYSSQVAGWNQAFTISTCTPEYDCSAGLDGWEKAWSTSKKAWCCQTTGDGCEFNCDAGYAEWEYDWSEAKKTWCCHAEGKGCTTTTNEPTPGPTPDPYAAMFQALLEKLDVHGAKLSNLEKMHETTTTQVTTTTGVPQPCTPLKDRHRRWCLQVCDNPRKTCKPLCSERCQGGCQCKKSRGGLTR